MFNYLITLFKRLSLVVATAPTDLMVNQISPTSITVTWTPPTPLGDTTGYIISYTSEDSDNSTIVPGGNTMEQPLTGLTMGASYDISVVATSQHFPSDPVEDDIRLGEYSLSCSPCKT